MKRKLIVVAFGLAALHSCSGAKVEGPAEPNRELRSQGESQARAQDSRSEITSPQERLRQRGHDRLAK